MSWCNKFGILISLYLIPWHSVKLDGMGTHIGGLANDGYGLKVSKNINKFEHDFYRIIILIHKTYRFHWSILLGLLGSHINVLARVHSNINPMVDNRISNDRLMHIVVNKWMMMMLICDNSNVRWWIWIEDFLFNTNNNC